MKCKFTLGLLSRSFSFGIDYNLGLNKWNQELLNFKDCPLKFPIFSIEIGLEFRKIEDILGFK